MATTVAMTGDRYVVTDESGRQIASCRTREAAERSATLRDRQLADNAATRSRLEAESLQHDLAEAAWMERHAHRLRGVTCRRCRAAIGV